MLVERSVLIYLSSRDEDAKEKFREILTSDEYINAFNGLKFGQSSIEVNLADITASYSMLAEDLLNEGEWGLKLLNDAAYELLSGINPMYASKINEISIRLTNLPEYVNLREIFSKDIGKIIKVRGIINRVSPIRPKYVEAVFRCRNCGDLSPPIPQDSPVLITPLKCQGCKRTYFDPAPEHSKFRDSQEIRVQELPEDTPSGQTANQLNGIIFVTDLINNVKCGDIVDLIGTVKVASLRNRGSKSLFTKPYLEVNNIIMKSKDPKDFKITVKDEEEILELSKNPNLFQILTASLAPSIYGHEMIKEACVHVLFGGVRKIRQNNEIRGDIHILLVGDPACIIGDSRIVKYDGTLPLISSLGDKHLEKIDFPLYSAVGNYKQGRATVFHKYENQATLEVITESGKRLIGTYNQCLKTMNGWKRLDELNKGTKIRVVSKIPCYKKTSPISKELGSLLGYNLADGWLSKYRVGFIVNNEEQDLIPKLKNYLLKEFNKKPRIDERLTTPFGQPRKNPHIPIPIFYLEICGKKIVKCFKNSLECLFNSANDVVACSLSWFFEGDGHILCNGRGKNGIFIKQGSDKNIEILRSIQLLLLRFGIYSILSEDSDGTKWLKIRRSNSIKRFAEYIGFQSIKKKEKLKILLSKLPDRRIHDKQWEKIKIIRPYGVSTVYDVEEPNYKQFVANGIVVHNTAKSQILMASAHVAPRGLFTSGRGATGVGLTAAVIKDEQGEPILAAGSLVLADRGVCCIDEIDKMKPEDRVSIHTAMEQGIITISKWGINTILNSQTSVLAAGNPTQGRWDENKSIIDNLSNIPITLFSRFDLIFVIKDTPQKEQDERMTEHMLGIHQDLPQVISTEFFRKYIAYAKRIEPKLSAEAIKGLKDFYISVRQRSNGTVTITPRQLESLVRLTEAHARMRLSKEATEKDVEAVLELFNKYIEDVGIDPETGKIDVDIIETGKTQGMKDKINIVLDVIDELNDWYAGEGAPKKEIYQKAQVEGVNFEDTSKALRELINQSIIYESKSQMGDIRYKRSMPKLG